MKLLYDQRLKRAIMFAVCMAATMWVAVSATIASSLETARFFLLTLLLFMIKSLFMKRFPSPTGSGAIVMAIGIFINGAMVKFPALEGQLARSLVLVLFILFLFIASSYAIEALQRKAFQRHFADRVGRFAVGTWIAGTSVCGVALCHRLPAWKPVVQALVVCNVGLWLYFISLALGSFLGFFASRELRSRANGVLFLSTVSTQSLVIVWQAAFGAGEIYRLVAPFVILLGVVFYFLSLYFVVGRYACGGANIDLDRDWFNTNCITHGAMSITGLASAVSGVVPPDLILLIWLWVVSWFVVIETIECLRAVERTKTHGVGQGLLIYDASQWSRNFTFGMLYAFTLNFDIARSAAAGTFLQSLHRGIIDYFAWMVLILLLLEIIVFLRDRLSLSRLDTM